MQDSHYNTHCKVDTALYTLPAWHCPSHRTQGWHYPLYNEWLTQYFIHCKLDTALYTQCKADTAPYTLQAWQRTLHTTQGWHYPLYNAWWTLYYKENASLTLQYTLQDWHCPLHTVFTLNKLHTVGYTVQCAHAICIVLSTALCLVKYQDRASDQTFQWPHQKP